MSEDEKKDGRVNERITQVCLCVYSITTMEDDGKNIREKKELYMMITENQSHQQTTAMAH
jgi:hypothetical protein